ncbi:MAG TPA: response regulator transcription factor [Rubrobacteraceae bacterium]|nr:response regulator transcription factor [Rubrobacteraceae bacterium]
MPRVMIVEDDAAVRDILTIALEREGMTVEAVGDGETALARISSAGPSPDIVLLDIMLPGVDGVTVCQELRRGSDVPVIMLTAREGERNVVVGLEVGADDYVTKPVSPAEVVSRVRAHLRRRRMDAQTASMRYEFSDLVVDLSRRHVWARGERVELTTTEFEILSFLAAHPGWVYTRKQIMQHLWDGDFYGDVRSADVHVQRIRKKIEPDTKNPRYIRTVRGMGYRFSDA